MLLFLSIASQPVNAQGLTSASSTVTDGWMFAGVWPTSKDAEKIKENFLGRRYHGAFALIQSVATTHTTNPDYAPIYFLKGVMLDEGLGTPKDASAAVKSWRKSAKHGNVNALYMLGVAYYSGSGVASDATVAKGYWEKAAAKGSAQANYSLGVINYLGHGTAVDTEAAQDYWRVALKIWEDDARSKTSGVSERSVHLAGHMYLSGLGTPANLSKAIERFANSAKTFPPSRYTLAKLVQEGCISDLPPVEANGKTLKSMSEFFESAANYGYPPAAYRLAKLWENSGKDEKEVLRYYEYAARGGDDRAQLELGTKIASNDLVTALSWIMMSAESGNLRALKERRILSRFMEPIEVEAARGVLSRRVSLKAQSALKTLRSRWSKAVPTVIVDDACD